MLGGKIGHHLQDGKRYFLTDHRSALQQLLGLRGSRSMRAARMACTVSGGELAGVARQSIVSRLAGERAGLGEVADGLFQEQRIAVGALDQGLLERIEAGIIAE